MLGGLALTDSAGCWGHGCLYVVKSRKQMHVEAALGRVAPCSGAADRDKAALVCAAWSARLLALSATFSCKPQAGVPVASARV